MLDAQFVIWNGSIVTWGAGCARRGGRHACKLLDGWRFRSSERFRLHCWYGLLQKMENDCICLNYKSEPLTCGYLDAPENDRYKTDEDAYRERRDSILLHGNIRVSDILLSKVAEFAAQLLDTSNVYLVRTKKPSSVSWCTSEHLTYLVFCSSMNNISLNHLERRKRQGLHGTG